jgi:hypothetical protein
MDTDMENIWFGIRKTLIDINSNPNPYHQAASKVFKHPLRDDDVEGDIASVQRKVNDMVVGLILKGFGSDVRACALLVKSLNPKVFK